MKALVYHGPDQRSSDSVPDPTIQESSDIVVKVATTTTCGSDPHIPTRRTDERGRPLSIFAARRQRGKVV